MENRSSSSSSEDSAGYSSTNVNVQKMDVSETSSSKSNEENLGVGVADKQKASSPGSSRVDHQLKSFDRHSKEGPVDSGSLENAWHPDQKSQFSTDKHVRNDEMSKKIEKNLENFLKEREPLKEVQLRKKTNISTRLARSEGEMAYILEYCANMLKDSTISNTQRSSAPPTFNSQRDVNQKPQTENLFAVEYSNEELNSKGIAQSSDTFKRDGDGTENTSTKALDLRLKKISTFKVPISPDTKTTDKSPKMVPTDSKKDVASPVQRPTHFNANPRKAFYTFSPGSPSGLLRQCQSLPNINRPRRKDEGQRRSVNLEEQSRIVRSLFRDKPEPATPESRVSTFYNRCLDTPESMEKSPAGEVPKPLQNIPSKTCRRLVFVSCSKETADKNQNVLVKKVSCAPEAAKNKSSGNAPQDEVSKHQNRPSKSCRKLDFGSTSKETTDKSQQNLVSCDEESPSKRKNESAGEIRCSISLKKVRLSSELKVEGNIASENVRKTRSLVDDKCPISAKEVKTSSGTKIEDDGSDEHVSLFDSECSASTKKVGTSSKTKMEGVGGGENVRKKTCPIDGECSSSAKKAKTASEIIVQSGSGENIKKHSIPIDVSSICVKKVRTSSEKKSDESESD